MIANIAVTTSRIATALITGTIDPRIDWKRILSQGTRLMSLTTRKTRSMRSTDSDLMLDRNRNATEKITTTKSNRFQGSYQNSVGLCTPKFHISSKPKTEVKKMSATKKTVDCHVPSRGTTS